MGSDSRVIIRLLACLLVFVAGMGSGVCLAQTEPTEGVDGDAQAPVATPGEAEDPAEQPDVSAAASGGDDPTAPEDRGDTYQRLREIGNHVDTLKEETFSTKSRLLLLRASVLRRSVAGSTVVVVHENDLGSEYELVQVLYALDREPKFERLDHTGKLDDMEPTVVIDEKLVPGSHILMVSMVFKGASWGVFKYMDGYTFTVKSSYAFTADEGKAHEITVRAHEQGNFFTPLEKRPTVTYAMSELELDATTAAAGPGTK